MTEPGSEENETDHSRIETAHLSEVETLPHRLGFTETSELMDIHREIVSAVVCGDSAARMVSLNRYLDIGEAMAGSSSEASPQIGLIIAQALIWQEANEPVRAIRSLLQAKEYANNLTLVDITDIIDAELDVHQGTGEELQGLYEFESAIDRYIEFEHVNLTDRDRGLLNLRLAECYQGLLEQDSEKEETIWLEELRDASLDSAIVYLEGQPDLAKVVAFRDEL
jgi:hypothetical protein